MNIYVGNLDYKVDKEDLKGIFEEYGNVSDSKIIMDKHSGRSKGFGFVVMEDVEAARTAIKELGGATLESREMIVSEAREKSNLSSNSGRRY
jgi:RNA recognition motif-containing protein